MADALEPRTAGALQRVAAVYRAAAIMLLTTIVLLVVVNLAAAALLRLLPAPPARYSARMRRTMAVPYYASLPDAATFWREHWAAVNNQRYEPFTVWRTAPFQGVHVNVDRDGLRHTLGAPCAPGDARVAMYGGSTVWGFGAADRGTIPSLLDSILEARGAGPVCVQNYGQPAYISTQETVEMLRHLGHGAPPDLALFYDGYNDCWGAWSAGAPGLHDRLAYFRAQLSPTARTRSSPLGDLVRGTALARLVARWAPRAGEPPAATPAVTVGPDSLEALAATVAFTYLANARSAHALGREHHFADLHAIQPWIRQSAKPLTPEERDIPNPDWTALCEAFYGRVRAQARREQNFVDLTTALDSMQDPVFIDLVHITPDGNRRIASLLAPAVAAALARTVSDR